MNYQQKDWLGSWQNFESYLVSTAPAMQACWTQAEEAAKALPMFQAGVKTFWQRACGTALAGPVLGGWQIEAANAQDLRITWLDAAGQPLDSAVYHFTGALEKGLKAGALAKEIAALAGGNGGGKPDFAMAGLKQADKVDAALAAVPGLVEKALA